MKRKIFSALSILIIFFIVILISGVYFNSNVIDHPFKVKNSVINIEVKQGDSLYSVIDKLDSEGKINSSVLMKLYIKGSKLNVEKIRTGKFSFNSEVSLSQFINILNNSDSNKATDMIKVTIPEGYDIEEIGSALEKVGLVDKTTFISSVKNYPLPTYVKKVTSRRYALEGFLFPDTYLFEKGTTADIIIKTMIDRFMYVINDIQVNKSIVIKDEDIDKTIVMASIVEREAKLKEERPIVASVFFNRLKINMKLESCATDQYALNVHKDILSVKDTKFESPYNTYMVSGLPVGPICCPGRASIEAALFPEDTNYLYFVYNGIKNDGSQIFSKTKAEHDAAVKKYLNNKK